VLRAHPEPDEPATEVPQDGEAQEQRKTSVGRSAQLLSVDLG